MSAPSSQLHLPPEGPEHTDSIGRIDRTCPRFTHPTTVMIPNGERLEHMQFDLFLLFILILLSFARLRRCCVCAGRIPLLRVFGLDSSLGFVDGIRK